MTNVQRMKILVKARKKIQALEKEQDRVRETACKEAGVDQWDGLLFDFLYNNDITVKALAAELPIVDEKEAKMRRIRHLSKGKIRSSQETII
jgi:hypothetical protein